MAPQIQSEKRSSAEVATTDEIQLAEVSARILDRHALQREQSVQRGSMPINSVLALQDIYRVVEDRQAIFNRNVVIPAEARALGAGENVRIGREQYLSSPGLTARHFFSRISGADRVSEKSLEADRQYLNDAEKDLRDKNQMLRSSIGSLSLSREMAQRGDIMRALVFSENALRDLEGAIPLDATKHQAHLKELGKHSEKVNRCLERTETTLRICRDGAIMAEVAVATGGTSVLLEAGAGISFLAGFGAGAGLSAITNTAEQGTHALSGSKSREQALNDGIGQLSVDLKNSALTAAGNAVAAPVAATVIGRAGTISSPMQTLLATTTGRAVATGSISEGLSAGISTTLDAGGRVVDGRHAPTLSQYGMEMLGSVSYGVASGVVSAKIAPKIPAPDIEISSLRLNAAGGIVGVAVSSATPPDKSRNR